MSPRKLSRLQTLGLLVAVPSALIVSLYLLYLLSQALHWALGLPAWLAFGAYLVLVLELRVAGEPKPKALLPAWARRSLLWAGQALLLVWLWKTGHAAFWLAMAMMVLAQGFAWRARRRRARLARDEAVPQDSR